MDTVIGAHVHDITRCGQTLLTPSKQASILRASVLATVLLVSLGCASTGDLGSAPQPCQSESTRPVEEASVTQGFVLVGGLSLLNRKLVVPASTRAAKPVRIVVEFVVDEKGCTRDYRLAEGSDLKLAAAAIKAIQDSAFIPAQLDGIPVPLKGSLPITVR